MNILVTSANSAAAHRLKNKLNTDTVILGDHHELPEFMLRSGKMLKLPNPASNAYAHEMLTLCLDHQIETIYPLREDEAAILNESVQLFKEYNISIAY